jgi:glutamate 5-kinase
MKKEEKRAKTIVVKVGSSVLTDSSGRPDIRKLKQLVLELALCIKNGQKIVYVSSGAIACGMAKLSMAKRPKELARLQACAAIGQGELMRLYAEVFAKHRLSVAQVLLTQSDLSNKERCKNAKETLKTLLGMGILPIINENDAVAVEEIAFGDNDRLAALVACVIEADLLVILSDVDGVLRNGKVIERIDHIEQAHKALAMGPSRETTTGGMASKLSAARISRHGGIPLIIANGNRAGILQDILNARPVGTLIAPPAKALKFHKWWIAFSMRKTQGSVIIDSGAAEALVSHGKSLLASGILSIRGEFNVLEPVSIIDEKGQELGRGLSNFSSSDIDRIKGCRSEKISEILGRNSASEVIHKDNLVLNREFEE